MSTERTGGGTTIRRATVADVPAVAALFDAYRQFYEQPPDRALATAYVGARLARNESLILVAEEASGVLQGFCQLYPTFCSVEARPIYVLYDLYVDATARRGGVAKQLMLAAEDLARANGVARMDLSTARTNVAAQRLYESLGWTRDEVYHVYNRRIAP